MNPHRRACVMCALVIALVWSSTAVALADGKKKRKAAARPAATEGIERFVVDGVREPSGIALHAGLHRLFVVGDEGSVGEIDGAGRTLKAMSVAGNLEDLAFHPPSGSLVLLVENPPALVVFDGAARAEKRRIVLDVAALLGEAPRGRKGQGFEGVAFRPEAGRPGGGVFYLAHQRSPATVVAAAFDPLTAESVGRDAVVGRWPTNGYRHLTAVSYDATSDRFLMIADRRLVILDKEGRTQSRSAPLDLAQPEGVCVDEAGALWIVDDPAGLVRFAAGPEALTLPVRGGTSPAERSGPWPSR